MPGGRHAGSQISTIIATTGNVGFVIVRLMLLAGQFNHGKRHMLNLTHTRLFTLGTGPPAGMCAACRRRFPLALQRDGWLGRVSMRCLLPVSGHCVRVFQMLAVVQQPPSARLLASTSARRWTASRAG